MAEQKDNTDRKSSLPISRPRPEPRRRASLPHPLGLPLPPTKKPTAPQSTDSSTSTDRTVSKSSELDLFGLPSLDSFTLPRVGLQGESQSRVNISSLGSPTHFPSLSGVVVPNLPGPVVSTLNKSSTSFSLQKNEVSLSKSASKLAIQVPKLDMSCLSDSGPNVPDKNLPLPQDQPEPYKDESSGKSLSSISKNPFSGVLDWPWLSRLRYMFMNKNKRKEYKEAKDALMEKEEIEYERTKTLATRKRREKCRPFPTMDWGLDAIVDPYELDVICEKVSNTPAGTPSETFLSSASSSKSGQSSTRFSFKFRRTGSTSERQQENTPERTLAQVLESSPHFQNAMDSFYEQLMRKLEDFPGPPVTDERVEQAWLQGAMENITSSLNRTWVRITEPRLERAPEAISESRVERSQEGISEPLQRALEHFDERLQRILSSYPQPPVLDDQLEKEWENMPVRLQRAMDRIQETLDREWKKTSLHQAEQKLENSESSPEEMPNPESPTKPPPAFED